MASLDSPIVTLGALYLAGQSEKGRPYTGGESGRGFIAGGFAGASSEYAAQRVRQAAGIDSSSVSDELAQALLGAAVSRFGDPIPMNKAMARGIHYNVATQAVQDAGLSLENLMGDTLGGGGSGTQATGTSSSNATSGRVGGTNIEWA